VFSRKEAFSVEGTLRSRGAEANKITRSVSSAGYAVKNYALGMDVAIEDRANMDPAFQFELEAGSARYLVDKLMLDWEKRLYDLANTAASVGTTFVPNSAWNAASNYGDPIAQIFKMIEQNQSLTAQRPNSIIFGWRAWNTFRRNQNVRNMILGSTTAGLVTREATRSLFELDRFIVSEAFYDTTNENQSSTLSSPLHDRVVLYYAPLAPSRDAPGLPAPLVVERHPYNTRRKVDGIEAGYYQDEKIVGADYASVLAGVNSAQSSGI